MKHPPLLEIHIDCPAAAEQPIAALLETVCASAASIYTRADTQRSTVSVFFQRPFSAALKRQLARGLHQLKSSLQLPSVPKIRTRRVPRQDWSESWKKYFKTINVGSKLLIKPSWSRQKPRRGQAVVVLDPGLSFGTGQHPTTAFCLEQLVAFRSLSQTPPSFLDLGTGSGILAVAAAKLGCHPVHALDNDPAAVRIAKSNARKNRVQKKITIVRSDLTRLPIGHSTSRSAGWQPAVPPVGNRQRPRQFDLICANLIDDLLINEQARILSRLAPSGRLVLAGILKRQFRRVQLAYQRRGFKLIATKSEGEWQSGAFAARIFHS